MNRVPAPRAVLKTERNCSTWENGWLLVAADLSGRRREEAFRGVVAFHPDGRCERATLRQLDRCGTGDFLAYRLVVQRDPESDQPRILRSGRLRDVGACFCLKTGGPVDVVWTDPLRVGKRLPHPDALPCYHEAVQDAGPLTVETLDYYVRCPANKWATTAHRQKLADAFAAAGRTGFVVFNRDSGEVRAFDLGEPVVRVEIRPDGLVAAAILKDNAVAFVDLGDD